MTTNLYPFVSKAQLKARLVAEPDFRKEAVVILFALQTEYEQNTASTLDRNRRGFMSSHSVHGTRIAKKILAGEELSAEDWGHVDAIAPRYSRQLAVYFRAKALDEQPELKAAAAIFGV
jgi:aspartate/tyrosine/aromatic aminotransferase